ncbi:MAG: SLBB domain-containing protein [Scytolyngbya sp. HA4215-MV1]|jgi:polysaccharide export outer membrane protein|nr:SLBB domain-containing protein [Scytolyngbya sp. HA4215-MV1]
MQKTGLTEWLRFPFHPLTGLGLFALLSFPLPGLAQSAFSPPPVPVSSSTFQDSGYLLGAGDRVRIDIFSVPEYSGEYLVLSDGTVNLPEIGAVSVRGMTPKQASAHLSARYKGVIKRPSITVSLLAARSVKIAIAGEINNPGTYTVSPVEKEGIPTVTRILQLAGGITQAADLRQIQVRRLQPGNTANRVFNLDLWQLIRTGDISQDLLLQDGDSIFIPTAAEINPAEAVELATASFAPTEVKALKVAVVGEVNRPGPYTLQPAALPGGANNKPRVLTLTQAIQAAGGITAYADIRKIELHRLTKTGTRGQSVTVNFWQLLQTGDTRQDLPLQEGDTILIPKATELNPSEATAIATASFSPDQIVVNVVGEVAAPGAVKVPPNTPLNQALLAAGGFNKRAARSSVDLIRLNPNGTVTKREIKIDLAQGANETSNPTLRNNDTIVIRRSGLAGVSDTLGIFLAPVTGVFSLFRILGL